MVCTSVRLPSEFILKAPTPGRCVSAFLGAIVSVSVAVAQGTYTEVADPGAGGGTICLGINGSGDIVGYYNEAAMGVPHGFLLSGGVYSTNRLRRHLHDIGWDNDVGEIIGQSSPVGSTLAFLASSLHSLTSSADSSAARSRQRKSQPAFAIGSSVDRLLFALSMLRNPTAKTRSREKGPETTAAQFAGAILCGSYFT